MNLELRSIVEPGNLAKERITLRAQSDLDLGDFLVAQSGFIDGSPTTQFFHTYWFPFKRIQKGDLVVIYTKEGIDRENKLKNRGKAHFFYFDLSLTIWNDQSKAAVILYAPTWISKGVPDF